MSFDYLIIGNSISGLTTAYRLAQLATHAKIGIVGPAARTGSATMAAGAMLGLFGEVTAENYADHYDRAYFELAYHAQSMWPDFIDEINSQVDPEDSVQIHPDGTFILFNTQDTHDYHAILSTLQEYKEPYEVVAPEDIPGLAPEQSACTSAGIYIPRERSVNPIAVLQALEHVLKKNPAVTQINDTAVQLCTTQPDHMAMAGVRLSNGDLLHAGQVILAAGVGSQDLMDTLPGLAGRIPYLMSGDGVSFSLDQQALGSAQIQHVMRTPNRAGAYSLHVVPGVKNHRFLYLGAGNIMQWKPQSGTSVGNTACIMRNSLREISKHLGNARLLRLNRGNRPTTVDGYPLFGACTCIAGLWLLTGTGRDGFQRSPLLSWHMARKLTGTTTSSAAEQTTRAIFEAFSPERPPVQTCSQAQAIAQLQHDIDRARQHKADGILTAELQTCLPDRLYAEISRVYAQLDTNLALPSMTLLPILCRRWPIDSLKSYLDAAKHCHPVRSAAAA